MGISGSFFFITGPTRTIILYIKLGYFFAQLVSITIELFAPIKH